MLFLISLALALAFVLLCGKILRKEPAPFYVLAAILSISAVCVTQFHLRGLPAWLNDYAVAQLTKGTLATACWAIVMWTGALPNGSKLMKYFMPVRGQLSVFAAILTLGHAVGFGISYIPRWLKTPDLLNFTVAAVLMLIMCPLAVMSVRKIRSKMKPKNWKRWQRLAYIFYVFIPVHVYALNLAKARQGRPGAWFSLMVYAVVFIGWAVMRLRKWYLTAKKPAGKAILNAAAACSGLVLVCGTGFLARAQQQPEPAALERTAPEIAVAEQTDVTQIAGSAAATETTAAQTSDAKKTETESTGTTVTDKTGKSDVTTETTASAAAEAADAQNDAQEETPQENDAPQETPQQPAATEAPATTPAATEPPVQRVYQNGTFSGNAYGYDGMIYLDVTIQDDQITAITITSSEEEDPWYLDTAKGPVIQQILATQSTSVDAVSECTFSSNAIMQAVAQALESAKN